MPFRQAVVVQDVEGICEWCRDSECWWQRIKECKSVSAWQRLSSKLSRNTRERGEDWAKTGRGTVGFSGRGWGGRGTSAKSSNPVKPTNWLTASRAEQMGANGRESVECVRGVGVGAGWGWGWLELDQFNLAQAAQRAEPKECVRRACDTRRGSEPQFSAPKEKLGGSKPDMGGQGWWR